jgi:uncharacterized protein
MISQEMSAMSLSSNEFQRYAPELAFPSYSYVTGQWPHPLRDPQGHSYGRHAELPPLPQDDDWYTSLVYRYAVDLFNHGYYWEAHETWEGLWHAAGELGPLADFFKALIKLAAAGVKQREGRPNGVQRHLARARELFTTVQQSLQPRADYWGLSFDELQTLITSYEQLPFDPQFTQQIAVLCVWPVGLSLRMK